VLGVLHSDFQPSSSFLLAMAVRWGMGGLGSHSYHWGFHLQLF